ncbi:MAG TPA: ATP-binding protein [Bacillota bacterium]|nr:ATP-binding protein [Bacillota bacterium]
MKQLYFLKAFLCILICIFTMLLFELSIFEQLNRTIYFSFMACIFFILILWVLSIWFFYKFAMVVNEERIARETDQFQLEESRKLVQTLQSQRHDYRNQLQVIRVLAQFNKNSEIIKYIDDYISLANVSAAASSRINNSAISALYLVYETEARDKGIKMTIDSDIDFTHFKYSPSKVTRIIGNIIRNAIECLEEINRQDREIQITMWEANDYYVISIWNNGDPIPETHIERIFLPGFSTKNSSGLGLGIVKELVQELGGNISVVSQVEFGTEFKITLPRTKPNSLSTA